MTHKYIKRFRIAGQFASDSLIPQVRERQEQFLRSEMYDRGYVELLDVRPSFSVSYDDGAWSYLLTMHGVKVGKEAAKWQGMMDGKLVPKHTQSNK